MTSPQSVRFAECDRETSRRVGQAGGVLLLPIGAIEQHGPHLPVWTDTLVVEHLAISAATRRADQVPLLVAPTLPFGSSAHHQPFGGTLSLDTSVLFEVLMSLGRSAQLACFRRLFLLNGHGGNHELVELAARDLSLQQEMDVAAASWWQLAWDGITSFAAGVTDDPAAMDVFAGGRVPGHAGAFETALVSALRPDLLGSMPHAHPRLHGGDPGDRRMLMRVERAGFWQAINGYTDQPGAISAEVGSQILDIAVAAVADAVAVFHAGSANDG